MTMNYVSTGTSSTGTTESADDTYNSIDNIDVPANCEWPSGNPPSVTDIVTNLLNLVGYINEHPNDLAAMSEYYTYAADMSQYDSQYGTDLCGEYIYPDSTYPAGTQFTGEGGSYLIDDAVDAEMSLYANTLAEQGDSAEQIAEGMLSFTATGFEGNLATQVNAEIANNLNTIYNNSTSVGSANLSTLVTEVTNGYDISALNFVTSGDWASARSDSNFGTILSESVQNKMDSLWSTSNSPVIAAIILLYVVFATYYMGQMQGDAYEAQTESDVATWSTKTTSDYSTELNDVSGSTGGTVTSGGQASIDAATLDADDQVTMLLCNNTWSVEGTSAATDFESFSNQTIWTEDGSSVSIDSTTVTTSDTDDELAQAFSDMYYNSTIYYSADSSGGTSNSTNATTATTNMNSLQSDLSSGGTALDNVGQSWSTSSSNAESYAEKTYTELTEFLQQIPTQEATDTSNALPA